MNPKKAHRLELISIRKTFPGVIANDDVSFAIQPGEIHALLGENGAGKSTLVKMIYGIMRPDRGEILIDGKRLDISSPKMARQHGVGMIFQHFSLFEAMTVLENIALGMDGKVSHSELEARIRGVLHKYGLALDPHRVVSSLSVGERQRIEIVRALLQNPTLLIMDEPTSVLTPQEVSQLFGTLRDLSAEGCSILYISHKLHEIQELCSAASVLRGGRIVGCCDPRKETSRNMAEMMIGAELSEVENRHAQELGAVKFRVDGLTVPKSDDFSVALNDIGFEVRAGEIFGIAGVAGNGQNELLLALGGETKSSGSVSVDGKPIGKLGSLLRRHFGLCVVPEERNGHGAVPDFSLTDNAILTARNRKNMVNWGVINHRAAEQYTDEVIKSFKVKATGTSSTAGSLSGGNLQKFIMGREILQKPEVLVVSQPTWGVDAGAAAAIHQEMLDLAASGSAIVVISQDLDELMTICDSLAVINEGHLSKRLNVADATIDEIGLLMGGVHGDPFGTAEMTGGIHAVEA